MANIGTLTARLGLDTKGLQVGAAQARGTFSGLEKSAVGSMGAIAASVGKMAAAFGVVMVGAKLVGAFKNMITIGADFEYTMATVGGVMRATGDEMKSLTAIAKKMGETTEWTASQSGEALKFLGMAGFKASKAVKALPGVLDLATAGNIELGRAADIASNALTAMNLPVKDLTRVNDVFIGTITRSNTNMEQMAESFKYAAPVARAFGYTVEELSGMIGALGDAGIQGSLSGTMLRRSMMEAAKIAKEMGFESDKLVDVLQSLKDIGEEDTVIMERFGMRAAAGIGAMLTQIPKIRKFQDTLKGVGGESKKLADTMRETLKGSFAELKSVIDIVRIEALVRFGDELDKSIKAITEWVRKNKEEIVTLIEVIAKSAMAVGNAITTLIGIFSDLTSTVRESADAVANLSDNMTELKTQVEANVDATERQAESFAKVLFFMNEVILVGPKLMDKLAKSTRAFGDALLGIATGGGPAAVDEFTNMLERLEEWLGKVRTGFERATPEWQAWLKFEAFLKSLAKESKGAAGDIDALAESQRALAAIPTPPPISIRLDTAQLEIDVEATIKQLDKLRQGLMDTVKNIPSVSIDDMLGLSAAQSAALDLLAIDERVKKEMLEREKQFLSFRILGYDENTEAYRIMADRIKEIDAELNQGLRDDTYRTVQFIGQQMDRWTDAIVASMQGAEIDMKRIFKQMAADFLRYFIMKSLTDLQMIFANAFLKMLMFFDKAANDRMAMKQGERYVGFFSRGAQEAMAQMDLAPAMTQMDLAPKMAQMNLAPAIASTSASGLSASAPSAFESHAPRKSDIQIVMNVNAPIISDDLTDWIVHDMAPIIERASKSGQTRIALEPFVQTGDPSGIIN